MRSVPLLLLCLALLAAACVTAPPGENGSGNLPPASAVTTATAESRVLSPGTYVFLDHHVSRNGEVTSGTCGGGMMIDFPTYTFSRETKELSGMSARQIGVNDSLQLVYGDGMSLGGAAGGGVSTWLTPVYAVPFAQGDVVITGIAPGGTVALSVAGQGMALPPGGSWKNVTVTDGPDDLPGTGGNCRVRITRTETLYNSGILDTSLIERG